MTQDEIIEMAEKAGFTAIWKKQYIISPYGFEDADLSEELVEFAKLVATKEREACAALVEREWSTNQEKALCDELASYIRARGEA